MKTTKFQRAKACYGQTVGVWLGEKTYHGTIVPSRAYLSHSLGRLLTRAEHHDLCRAALHGLAVPPFSWLVWFDGSPAPIVLNAKLRELAYNIITPEQDIGLDEAGAAATVTGNVGHSPLRRECSSSRPTI